MPKKPAPAGSSFELTYSAALRRAALATHSAAQSTRPLTSSTWVLTIVGGLFGVFVLLVLAFFAVLELA